MAFDWEYFAKEGMSPAVKMYQDYITGGIRSQLSQQDYQQRMQKAQYDAQIKSRQRKEDYDFDKLLEDVKYTNKRQFLYDKEAVDDARDWNKYRHAKKLAKYGRGTKELGYTLQHKNDAYNFDRKEGLAVLNSNLKLYGTANPEGMTQVKQADFIKNQQHYTTLNDVIMKATQENINVQKNANYRDLYNRQLTGKLEPEDTEKPSLSESEQKQLNTFNDRYKANLEKIDKATLALNEVREQIFRGEAGYKYGKKIPHTLEQAQWLKSIGFPVLSMEPNPNSLPMADHVEFIRKSGRDNRKMPNDAVGLMKAGYDPAWLEKNWEELTQYFTMHPSYTVKELFELMGIKK